MKEFFKFPTGEVHCKISDPFSQMLYVPMQDNLNDYLMTVLLAIDANNRALKHERFDVFMPYLPYSRQDRPTSAGEPFSLKVVGNLLNQAPCRNIYTLDVHSDVAFACVDRLINIDAPVLDMLGINDKLARKTLVVPDQGAFKKLGKLSDKFANTVICVKHRDISTGHLAIQGLMGDVSGKDCLIVDDICDGGMTFILLSKYLHKQGAKSVELAVTHGVFSKGLVVLFDAGISKVYTTDSFDQSRHSHLQEIIVTSANALLINRIT